jgi:hypothetical protein
MTTSNMRCSLRRLFPTATVALFPRQIAIDQNNKRLIACDRQVPRWVYVFEMDVMATL